MGKHGSILPGRDYQAFLNERPAIVHPNHHDEGQNMNHPDYYWDGRQWRSPSAEKRAEELNAAINDLAAAIREHAAQNKRLYEAVEKTLK